MWSVDADGLVMTGPSVESAAGTVYVGSHDSNCYALAMESGDERWRSATVDAQIGRPTVIAEHVIVGRTTATATLSRSRQASRRWRVAGVGRVTGTPLVHDWAVYFTDRASQGWLHSGDGPTRGCTSQ